MFVSNVPLGDLLTTNGGATWRQIQSPCTGNLTQSLVATADGTELWQLCMSFPQAASPDSADKVMFVSRDGGRAWSQVATSQAGGTLPASGTLLSIASPRVHVLVLGSNRTPVLRTQDSGSSWEQVVDLPFIGVVRLRFHNENDGFATNGVQGGMWITTDGGVTWSELPPYNPAP